MPGAFTAATTPPAHSALPRAVTPPMPLNERPTTPVAEVSHSRPVTPEVATVAASYASSSVANSNDVTPTNAAKGPVNAASAASSAIVDVTEALACFANGELNAPTAAGAAHLSNCSHASLSSNSSEQQQNQQRLLPPSNEGAEDTTTVCPDTMSNGMCYSSSKPVALEAPVLALVCASESSSGNHSSSPMSNNNNNNNNDLVIDVVASDASSTKLASTTNKLAQNISNDNLDPFTSEEKKTPGDLVDQSQPDSAKSNEHKFDINQFNLKPNEPQQQIPNLRKRRSTARVPLSSLVLKSEFKDFETVWAKFDKSYWPSVILPEENVPVKNRPSVIKNNCYSVIFHGDHSYSAIPKAHVVPFLENLEMLRYANEPGIENAISEALNSPELAIQANARHIGEDKKKLGAKRKSSSPDETDKKRKQSASSSRAAPRSSKKRAEPDSDASGSSGSESDAQKEERPAKRSRGNSVLNAPRRRPSSPLKSDDSSDKDSKQQPMPSTRGRGTRRTSAKKSEDSEIEEPAAMSGRGKQRGFDINEPQQQQQQQYDEKARKSSLSRGMAASNDMNSLKQQQGREALAGSRTMHLHPLVSYDELVEKSSQITEFMMHIRFTLQRSFIVARNSNSSSNTSASTGDQGVTSLDIMPDQIDWAFVDRAIEQLSLYLKNPDVVSMDDLKRHKIPKVLRTIQLTSYNEKMTEAMKAKGIFAKISALLKYICSLEETIMVTPTSAPWPIDFQSISKAISSSQKQTTIEQQQDLTVPDDNSNKSNIMADKKVICEPTVEV